MIFLMIFFTLTYNQNKFKPNLTYSLNSNELNILLLVSLIFILKTTFQEISEKYENLFFTFIAIAKISLFVLSIKKFVYYKIILYYGKKGKETIICNIYKFLYILMIFTKVEKEAHELKEATNICLYKEKNQNSNATFSTIKIFIEKNDIIENEELSIFQFQNKEIKFLNEFILNNFENKKEEEISIENECLSEGIKSSKAIILNEEINFIKSFIIWEHYFQIKIFEKNGIMLKMRKTAIENTCYIKVDVSIKDNLNQILLKEFEPIVSGSNNITILKSYNI